MIHAIEREKPSLRILLISNRINSLGNLTTPRLRFRSIGAKQAERVYVKANGAYLAVDLATRRLDLCVIESKPNIAKIPPSSGIRELSELPSLVTAAETQVENRKTGVVLGVVQ